MGANIDDGYTLSGYFHEQPGLHPSVRLKYRPLTIDEDARAADALAKMTSKTSENDFLAQTIARHVIEWDLTVAGRVVPLTAADIKRNVRPGLFSRIYMLIAGMKACDVDPLGNGHAAEKQDEHIDAEAILSGTTPITIREERDTKN